MVEVLRGQVPGWQYQELPRGGHMFPLTQSDMINRLISGFMIAKSATLASVSTA
jgi:hypothetical protein